MAREFRRGWRPLAAATYGTGTSAVAILTYTSGVFYPGLSEEVGISRFQFGLAFTFATMGLALATPFAGALMDRFGSRIPIITGIVLFGLALTLVGLTAQSVVGFIALTGLVGLLGSPTGPVGYTREVSLHFSQHRGLALGIAQAGAGVSGAFLPALVALVIGSLGWRAGYFALAAVALTAIPGVAATFQSRQVAEDQPDLPVTSIRPVLLSRPFWIQLIAFMLLSFGTSGLALHFVPMLLDMGQSLATAATWASLIGISIICSRIGAGWLADRWPAPLIAAAICVLGVAGALVFATGNPALAPVGALLVGCVIGAEIDLLSFMTAKFFPSATYGRTYAWQYFGVAMASAASPALIGFLADKTGEYSFALAVSACLSASAMVFFVFLQHVTKRTRSADGPLGDLS
jgi:MFS family permease